MVSGQVSSASNPYRSSSDGSTQYAYDGLGRTTQIARQNGNTVGVSYSVECTTTTDEKGNQKKSCVDGLGRITQVFEPDSGGGLNWETAYAYDVLNNLTSVTQNVSAWLQMVVGIAGVLLGTFWGVRLLRRIPEQIFRRLVSIVIAALGLYMLGRGLMG